MSISPATQYKGHGNYHLKFSLPYDSELVLVMRSCLVNIDFTVFTLQQLNDYLHNSPFYEGVQLLVNVASLPSL